VLVCAASIAIIHDEVDGACAVTEAMTDVSWHDPYTDQATALSRRLRIIQAYLRDWPDATHRISRSTRCRCAPALAKARSGDRAGRLAAVRQRCVTRIRSEPEEDVSYGSHRVHYLSPRRGRRCLGCAKTDGWI